MFWFTYTKATFNTLRAQVDDFPAYFEDIGLFQGFWAFPSVQIVCVTWVRGDLTD